MRPRRAKSSPSFGRLPSVASSFGTAKLVWRGCGSLPHVGAHPGTAFLLVMLAAGLLAGSLGGLAIMGAVCLPIYLLGAYERAVLSERLSK